MATYTSTGNGLNLDLVQNHAERVVLKKLHSSLYQRSPIITFFTGKYGGDSPLGRPGTGGILGGLSNFSRAERETADGYEIHVRRQTQDSTVTRHMGTNGTSPSMGNAAQNRDRTTAYFRWATPLTSAIKIDGIITRIPEKVKIANEIEEATQQALNNHLDTLKYELWRGNPTTQTADEWDAPLGILQAIDTDNTYGNIARSGSTHYWAGNRVTTAVEAKLDLLEHANLGVESCSSIGKPLHSYGMGADLWIASNAIYYKLKKEALARGQSVMVGEMPEFAKVGVKYECIKYGNTSIVNDPTLTGDWSAYDSDVSDATKVLVGLTTEDWRFGIRSTNNFRVGPLKYQADQTPGGDDAVTGTLYSQYRLYCLNPHRQIVFTNVS